MQKHKTCNYYIMFFICICLAFCFFLKSITYIMTNTFLSLMNLYIALYTAYYPFHYYNKWKPRNSTIFLVPVFCLGILAFYFLHEKELYQVAFHIAFALVWIGLLLALGKKERKEKEEKEE